VSINKQPIVSQNCFGVLSLLCQGKGSKIFSHFKCLRGHHNALSRAACCPRATGWAVLC